MSEQKKLYRCGWCGCPCQEDGTAINLDAANLDDWEDAEQAPGDCCRAEMEYRHQYILATLRHADH